MDYTIPVPVALSIRSNAEKMLGGREGRWMGGWTGGMDGRGWDCRWGNR
jgi:hypothetical protein